MPADPATTALVITAIGSAVSGAILAAAKLVESIAYFRGDDRDQDNKRHHRRPPPFDDDDGPDERPLSLLPWTRLA